MGRIWKYVLVGLLIFGLVFVVALSFFSRGIGGYNSNGISYPGWMMGGGGYGPMMGGWGYSPFGWIGMIFMWLIPVTLVVVVVFGIIWLVRATAGVGGSNLSATRTCPNCGRAAQADWRTCPYCGQALP
jgi:hypothetical protein